HHAEARADPPLGAGPLRAPHRTPQGGLTAARLRLPRLSPPSGFSYVQGGVSRSREPGGAVPEIPYVDIQPLDQEAIREILRRNHVGRIAYCYQNRVGLEPRHAVFGDDWIWARTSPGTRLAVVERNWWVAFAVGAVDALFEWRSVV